MTLMARRQQLCNRYPVDPPTKFAETQDRLVDFGLAELSLRYQASDRPPVPGDDNSFAALDLVEDLRQMRLCFRGLNLSHNGISIGLFDWSKDA